MTTFDEYIQNASRLTFEDYDDYTLEEMANRLSFKIFECRSVFHTLPKNTRMLYIIAYNETIHEIRRRIEQCQQEKRSKPWAGYFWGTQQSTS